MANTHTTLTSLFDDIADSIRSKTGGTAEIVADNFPTAIDAIETCPEDALFLGTEPTDTAITLPRAASWSAICYSDGKYVAVSSQTSNTAAYSTDGMNWTATTLPSYASWSAAACGNGTFVTAVDSSSTNLAAYSTDGITWTATTMPQAAGWAAATYGNDKFVMIAYNSNVAAYSTDGINWTATTLPSSSRWYSITYGDGKFVAISQSNIAAYSTDGINWTETSLPAYNNWRGVAYGNGMFVAVVTNKNYMAYSTDGINWTGGKLPSSSNPKWSLVAYGDNKFVTVSSDGSNLSDAAAYSTDGITWTATTMPISKYWTSMAYCKDRFIVVAGGSTVVVHSTDGINWSDKVVKNIIVDVNDANVTEETVTAVVPTQAAATIIPGTSTKTAVATGVYTTGAVTVAGDADLKAANIKSGVDIFGVTGTYVAPTDTTAGVDQILADRTAYINGRKVTGTMPYNGYTTATITCGNSFPIAKGYHEEGGVITAKDLASQTVADATATDVASGKTAWVNGSKITGTGEMASDLAPELTDQDAKIAELQELLQGKAVPAPEDLTEELAAQSEIIAEQDELITQLATALEGKAGVGVESAEVLSGTVTPTDDYNITISDAIGKDNVVLMARPSEFNVGAIKKDYICSFTCQNDYMNCVIAGGGYLAFYDVNDFFDLFIFDKTTGTVSLNTPIYERFCQDTYQYFTW